MPQTISFLKNLSVSDDVQRMLLCCILRDARELHFDATDTCCLKIGYSCSNEHHRLHTIPVERYNALSIELETYEDRPDGTVYPLTADDLDTLAAALPEAITYRTGRDAPDDRALSAAYREMAGVAS